MWSWLRRVFWVALLAGAGYLAFSAWQRKSNATAIDPPTWPPLADADATGSTTAPVDPTMTGPDAPGVADDTSPAWVLPDDGQCPDGYPIKVNVKTGIYHVPGGRFYARAVPERCYANEASAEADGYRRAKA
jgi:hypothetical protein